MTTRRALSFGFALGTAALAFAAAPAFFADVRGQDISAYSLSDDHVRSLWFNRDTIFHPGNAPFATSVMELGRDPGLGVRGLQAAGIVGAGVDVAIIDQNLLLGHPEYSGRIAGYWDLGCGLPPGVGSMHGPAVASLLVGDSIGTAPGARLYYYAVPSWLTDAAYYAAALKEIVMLNASSPANIRVVSVSAAPSGPGSPFKNQLAWETLVQKAEAAGILVLDCTGLRPLKVGACYYDVADPDEVAACHEGRPNDPGPYYWNPGTVLAPSSFRTQAEAMSAGVYSYQYMGCGGVSWSVPYVAGVLAMGWQLRPNLTGLEMAEILVETSYNAGSYRIVNPGAFIEFVASLP